MEHLFAYPTGTLFEAHRGDLFNKVIHMITNQQLSFGIKIPANSECELTIRARNAPEVGPHLRNFTFMWLNVANLNPHLPDVPRMEVRQYLEQVVPGQEPDVLIISSTGNAFNAVEVPGIMVATGHTLAYQVQVGADGGVFSIGFVGNGNMWLNEGQGNNIETGIVIEYDWF